MNSLRIGNTTIGENELSILKKLANGELVVEMYNTAHGQYLYAASDGFNYDGDRRRVFTWGPGDRINQGYWRLRYPR